MDRFIKFAFLVQVLLWAALVTIGTLCVNYDLSVITGRTIPAFWAFVINLFTGGVPIALAIVFKILTYLHIIVAPLLHK